MMPPLSRPWPSASQPARAKGATTTPAISAFCRVLRFFMGDFLSSECAVRRDGSTHDHRQSCCRRSDWFRSEEHTSELQSLMRISYAVFCLKKKIKNSQIDPVATVTTTQLGIHK